MRPIQKDIPFKTWGISRFIGYDSRNDANDLKQGILSSGTKNYLVQGGKVVKTLGSDYYYANTDHTFPITLLYRFINSKKQERIIYRSGDSMYAYDPYSGTCTTGVWTAVDRVAGVYMDMVTLNDIGVIAGGESIPLQMYTIGSSVAVLTGSPPNLDALEIHKNRIFGIRGSSVWYSEINNPAGTWNEIQVDLNNRHDFVAIKEIAGTLYFFKSNKAYYLDDYADSTTGWKIQAVSDQVDNILKGGVFNIPDMFSIVATRFGLYAFSSNGFEHISDTIDEDLKAIDYVERRAFFYYDDTKKLLGFNFVPDNAIKNYSFSDLNSGMYTNPNLAIGSTNTNVATDAFTYIISGVKYSKTAVAAGTAPGNDVVPQGKYGAVALDIGTDGTIDATEATDNATGYTSAVLAIQGLPAVASGHVRMGYITATKSDSAFTFGTTALDAANSTVTYTNTYAYGRIFPNWTDTITAGGTVTQQTDTNREYARLLTAAAGDTAKLSTLPFKTMPAANSVTVTETTTADFDGGTLDGTDGSGNSLVLLNTATIPAPVICDSHSEVYITISSVLGNGSITAVGQSITGNGKPLYSGQFYLKKYGNPTGNAVCKIYAHSGVFGTSSVPTGAVLATSNNFDVSTLTSDYALVTFTFSNLERIKLVNGTNYCIAIEYSGGDSSNKIYMGATPTGHSGNSFSYSSSAWHSGSADLIFYVYTGDIVGTRESTALDISTTDRAELTSVAWNATLNSQTMTIETALSLDGGSTYQDWETVAATTDPIPGIDETTDLSRARLKYRATLSTTNVTQLPQLDDITFTISREAIPFYLSFMHNRLTGTARNQCHYRIIGSDTYDETGGTTLKEGHLGDGASDLTWYNKIDSVSIAPKQWTRIEFENIATATADVAQIGVDDVCFMNKATGQGFVYSFNDKVWQPADQQLSGACTLADGSLIGASLNPATDGYYDLVYPFTGNDLDGEDIDGAIVIGPTDFNYPEPKRFNHMYFTMPQIGNYNITVTVENETGQTRTQIFNLAGTDTRHEFRMNVGLVGRYFKITFSDNSDNPQTALHELMCYYVPQKMRR